MHNITFRVVGPCSVCGKQIDGSPDNQAHMSDTVILCEACCPWCRKQEIDWSTHKPVVNTAGEQDDLFKK